MRLKRVAMSFFFTVRFLPSVNTIDVLVVCNRSIETEFIYAVQHKKIETSDADTQPDNIYKG